MRHDRRALRKRGVLVAVGRDPAEARGRADAETRRRLIRVNAVAATAFVVWGVVVLCGGVVGAGACRWAATGDELAVGVANWSTFAGAACFALAGVMQEFERP
jgi:hypothetical protein